VLAVSEPDVSTESTSTDARSQTVFRSRNSPTPSPDALFDGSESVTNSVDPEGGLSVLRSVTMHGSSGKHDVAVHASARGLRRLRLIALREVAQVTLWGTGGVRLLVS